MFKKINSPIATARTDFLLCFLSAVLLIFSFPRFEISALAWVALVPFLMALDGKTKRAAFGAGYLTGFIFFLGCFYWFAFIATIEQWVTLLGMVALVAYLALYFGLFAIGYAHFLSLNLLARLFVLPSVWVVLEFVRGHFLSGFGWASLGHSQYQNWVLIQIADITGVAGVSFLIVMVNVLVKETVVLFCRPRASGDPDGIKLDSHLRGNDSIKELRQAQTIVFLIVLAVASYGVFQLRERRSWPEIKVAVVQPNVAQEVKWLKEKREEIVHTQIELSKEVLDRRPDLVVWPETSFPGFIDDDPLLTQEVLDFAKSAQTPFLMGLIVEDGGDYYNSALLISDDGTMGPRYDKLHLVAFGEYLPLRRQLPFLDKLVPIEDFTAGQEYKVLTLAESSRTLPPFSVLICFEDTIGDLARHFVKAGAQFLVNITNDAWFGESKAPTMHLQAAVFRTVENRRALVRCANTGVSGFIDPLGRIIDLVEDNDGHRINAQGVAMAHIPANDAISVYTKLGDIFTLVCFVCILAAVIRKKI